MKGARTAEQLKIRLPDEAKQKLKMYAMRENKTMQSILEGVIIDYINSLPDIRFATINQNPEEDE